MRNRYRATLALAGLLALGAAVPAFAAGNDEAQEAVALQGAKVTLPQAIATAEQHTGGQAFDAGADSEGGKPRIVVETTGPKGVQTVVLDAQTGKITSSHAGGEKD
ncbi:MAG: PepSY domain-containing protein [Acetobacteraceae bacterium]